MATKQLARCAPLMRGGWGRAGAGRGSANLSCFLRRRLGLVRACSAHCRAGLAAPSREWHIFAPLPSPPPRFLSAAASQRRSVSCVAGQRFRYVVVIDFESTCWSGGTSRRSPEISRWQRREFCLVRPASAAGATRESGVFLSGKGPWDLAAEPGAFIPRALVPTTPLLV